MADRVRESIKFGPHGRVKVGQGVMILALLGAFALDAVGRALACRLSYCLLEQFELGPFVFRTDTRSGQILSAHAP
jgi:hypothetical protein